MSILKSNIVVVSLVILLVNNLACRHCENRFSPLEYYNHFVESDYHSIESQKFDKTLSKNYCFKISHDCKSNLTEYNVVLRINGSVIYNGPFKPQIVCPYVKEHDLNTFYIVVYEQKSNHIFSWTNKEVYDFEDAEKHCYEITLLSFKNFDHENSVEMIIK